MRARTAVETLPRGVVRVSDGLLDSFVLALAAWTAIYHVCLLSGVGTRWAVVAWAAALVPSAWLAARIRGEPEPRADGDGRARPRGVGAALRVANVLAALVSAALFAFTDAPWLAVWSLWVVSAAAAVAATVLALVCPRGDKGPSGARASSPSPDAAPAPAGAAVALAWAVALAALSLFLVDPDGDDAQYVHLSAWVAAHGYFPLRDILFTNGELPAVIYPPVSSLEALAGTLARATGLAVPDLVYLGVTPVATGLAVLALWRLLRTWRAPMVGVALSVSVVFLLMAAEEHRMLGRMFVGRLWHGKVIFVAVLVPLLFALLHEYAEAPTRRRLALLVAAGAAGVGLTASGTFLVPVAAAGALVPVAVRVPRRATTAFAATIAYPLAMAVAILVVGPRNAEVSHPLELVPEDLVEQVLGQGAFAFVTLAALLVAPLAIGGPLARAMAAGTLLFVGLLYAPGVPLGIFELTGLGEVQWRWTWTIPAAALVGALGTGLLPRVRPALLRAAPALVLAAAFVALGQPLWKDGATLARTPAWKRDSWTIRAAERILGHLQPGDSILAPRPVTHTVLVMSGEVTAVAPRGFYARALRDVPGGHADERLVLLLFAENGLGRVDDSPDEAVIDRREVVRALRMVRVDLACVASGKARAQRLLVARGYSRAVSTEGFVCLRAPDSA